MDRPTPIIVQTSTLSRCNFPSALNKQPRPDASERGFQHVSHDLAGASHASSRGGLAASRHVLFLGIAVPVYRTLSTSGRYHGMGGHGAESGTRAADRPRSDAYEIGAIHQPAVVRPDRHSVLALFRRARNVPSEKRRIAGIMQYSDNAQMKSNVVDMGQSLPSGLVDGGRLPP